MDVPKQAPLIEGEIADYHYDSSGILISYSKSPRRTVRNIEANIALVKSITGNKRVPLLIYLTKSPVPDRATQRYVNAHLADVYTAMAMVSKPGLAQFIMNFLFSFREPPIPMRSFSDPEAAKAWLQAYIDA